MVGDGREAVGCTLEICGEKNKVVCMRSYAGNLIEKT